MIKKIKQKIENARKQQLLALQNVNRRKAYFWLSTWFGSGLITPASGTWGTLFSMPFVIAAYIFGGAPALIIGCALIFFIGLWSAHQFEKDSKAHDSSMIVIDETAGMFLAAATVNGSALSFVLAFILFRFFDAVKPWPISWLDKKVDGAFGVMIDDIAAGLFAAIALWGIHGFI
tara:strand:+ start:113220 stop:113744 length:525 start_codon:yes stop_codon:yes gene_type:complete